MHCCITAHSPYEAHSLILHSYRVAAPWNSFRYYIFTSLSCFNLPGVYA